MITASADPAADIKLLMSAAVMAFRSKDDLWECEAEEMDERAESIEDVLGIARFPGRSPMVDGGGATGELGGDCDG
jgi:hypothetical protein